MNVSVGVLTGRRRFSSRRVESLPAVHHVRLRRSLRGWIASVSAAATATRRRRQRRRWCRADGQPPSHGLTERQTALVHRSPHRLQFLTTSSV